jgi:hypothetical protein
MMHIHMNITPMNPEARWHSTKVYPIALFEYSREWILID